MAAGTTTIISSANTIQQSERELREWFSIGRDMAMEYHKKPSQAKLVVRGIHRL